MSVHEHLSDDALLNGLYGLADEDMRRLECPVCAERWNQWRRKRESLAATGEVSSDFLLAQRRKIYERVEQPARKRLKWAPALAAACLVAAGVFFYRPAAPPAVQRPDVTDSQLFADAYSMDQSLEPSAAAPIHALFEDEN